MAAVIAGGPRCCAAAAPAVAVALATPWTHSRQHGNAAPPEAAAFATIAAAGGRVASCTLPRKRQQPGRAQQAVDCCAAQFRVPVWACRRHHHHPSRGTPLRTQQQQQRQHRHRRRAPPATSRPLPAVSASLDAFVVGYEGVLWDPHARQLHGAAADALAATQSPFYVIARRPPADVSGELKSGGAADIPADSPRILSTGGGLEKLELLSSVNQRPLAQDPSNTMHYVDADEDVLAAVVTDPQFDRWQLYIATWCDGFATDSPGSSPAVKLPARVRRVGLSDFPELLKWGLLMGVNDGCQEYEDGTPAA